MILDEKKMICPRCHDEMSKNFCEGCNTHFDNYGEILAYNEGFNTALKANEYIYKNLDDYMDYAQIKVTPNQKAAMSLVWHMARAKNF